MNSAFEPIDDEQLALPQMEIMSIQYRKHSGLLTQTSGSERFL